ncbi:MAG: hypothetical protein A3I75_07290 [Deltaproteobacteria bacterium RIFCSPLOWO2_02_FULL_50_16]|nr:MAG: hypothetical protein A3I75_07290 [Deltaproteobacteria bacterium RIFCSPLOWO2_02_FULL_50_16]
MEAKEEKKPSEKEQGSESVSMIRTLTIVAIISGILIVGAYQWTGPTIKKNKAEFLRKAIFQTLPQIKELKIFKEEPAGILVPLVGEEEKATRYFAGYDASGALVGVVVEAEGQGFQDVIRIIYAYSPEKKAIVGFKVLETKETPGLGDKIEKDPHFLENFEALDVRLDADQKSLVHPIEVVKIGNKKDLWQIDAITGATISSKAVGRMVNKSAGERVPVIEKNLSLLKGGS